VNDPLNDALLEHILERIPALTVAVVGDLFLDRYLDLDGTLTEPSLETGLDAYQVVGVRPSPGAAGTVLNNLVALGVGRVCPVAVLGDDGEGYELRRALAQLPAVVAGGVFSWDGRRTPTYTKPMLSLPGQPARELNRLDIQNRRPLPPEAEQEVVRRLAEVWRQADALVVMDQVGPGEFGVVTARVREKLAELGAERSERVILADSRFRIGLFRAVCLKPNERECRRAAADSTSPGADLAEAVRHLAARAGRPVFCTRGESGILLCDPRITPPEVREVPAYLVDGPTDPVGAGDSTSAGIACALAAGHTPAEAAAFGNLVASVTVAQVGMTGTATPEQLRRRQEELRGR
jgi:rfaE bifunctional protein kinase chain/domain